ncbi:molybdate ABC transporter substrate-binding protein [Teredinibacter haidensis]|mgnify:CR=1 FL=1|uniref:molybdate ABC transporter substrate-binding protein n=1 Tax=Teredinibacter haidensis TaxID=2731755 RepID=UPI00094917F7|nr:molybdate ABC transporter substrate-binding protein [Teredinibacter haidensis]
MKKVILLIICFLLTGQAFAAETIIAVAANFTDAMRNIVPLFEQSTGHSVKVSFGSTGKLFSQIENGAPFDVFLAADTKRPSKAEEKMLAVKGTRFTYARGKLVLWSAIPGLFNDGEAYLKKGDFKRIAIANPKTAPYGLAAQQVLEYLSIWNVLQRKLVRGDSIAQTFQFTATRNAEIGFVALSQVKSWRGKPGSFWEIPESGYAPIAQQAVLLKKGEKNTAAKAFLEFLKEAKAQAVIARLGYGVENSIIGE